MKICVKILTHQFLFPFILDFDKSTLFLNGFDLNKVLKGEGLW